MPKSYIVKNSEYVHISIMGPMANYSLEHSQHFRFRLGIRCSGVFLMAFPRLSSKIVSKYLRLNLPR